VGNASTKKQRDKRMSDKKIIRVLIVDDNDLVRLSLKLALRDNQQFSVSQASNGHQGINLYQQDKPDVVILDLIMPKMDGIETYKRIIEIDPRARTVILSAMLEKELISTALEAGISSFLSKGEVSMENLPGYLRDVYKGEKVLSPQVETLLTKLNV